MFFFLIFIVFFLYLFDSFESETMVSYFIQISDSQEGSQNLFWLFVGEKLNWGVLNEKYQSQYSSQDGKDKHCKHNKLPAVDQIKGERVKEISSREGQGNNVVEEASITLSKELYDQGKYAAI